MSVLKKDNPAGKEEHKKGKQSGRNTVQPVDISPRKHISKKSISAMKATVSPETVVKKKFGKKK